MNLLGLAVYIVIWWLAFFMVLPLGVRNHDEAGVETAAGVERAAPHAPKLLKKAALAAGIAAIIWILGYFAFATGAVSLIPEN